MYKYGSRQDDEAYRQEDLIEQEILNSSAVANDLTHILKIMDVVRESFGSLPSIWRCQAAGVEFHHRPASTLSLAG